MKMNVSYISISPRMGLLLEVSVRPCAKAKRTLSGGFYVSAGTRGA